ARTVGAVDDADLAVGQRGAGIERDDGRIVPGGDLAEEDVGQHRTRQLELSGCQAFEVDDGYHATDRGRELAEAGLRQLLARERFVAGAEIDGAGLDLGNAAARADRLVIDLGAGGGVVVGRPLRHQREDERRAGTRDLGAHALAGRSGRRGFGPGGLAWRGAVGRAGGGEQGGRQGQQGQAGEGEIHGQLRRSGTAWTGCRYEMMFLLHPYDATT